jgi:predicted MFS family arabinose efflux permease
MRPETANSRDDKWLAVGLLFLAGFLNTEDRIVIFSILPLMERELQLTSVQIGLLMSAFLWVYAACSPLAGYLGDRWPRRRVLTGCLFAWSAITIVSGLVTTAGQLLAVRALLGVAQAFYIPASYAILADYHSPATRGTAAAILHVGLGLGPVIGGSLAGAMGTHYGWRPTLFLLGAAGLLLAMSMRAMLRDVKVGAVESCGAGPRPAARTQPFWPTLTAILPVHTFLTLLVASGIAAIAIWMLTTWLPLFLYEQFQMDLTSSAFLGNLVLSVPGIPGFLLGGYLSDALGRKHPKNRMLLMIVFYAAAIPWPLVFRGGTGVTVILAGAALFLLFRSLAEANWHPVMYEIIPPEQRSTATGIANAGNCLMGGVGALVGGVFKESLGLQRVFGVASAFLAVSVILLYWAYARCLDSDLARRIKTPAQEATVGTNG